MRQYQMRTITGMMLIGLLASFAAAQEYDLAWHTIDGGGGYSAGGAFELEGTIGQHDAGPESAGMQAEGFSVVGGFWTAARHAGTSCESAHDCADLDADGIRDDGCVWSACQENACAAVDIVFADLGGAFGDCAPDGFANLFDRTHALTCFAGNNPCDSINIDAGGAFGSCVPDGFCNLFDANHVLTSFSGSNTCTCPGSPAPQVVLDSGSATSLSLRADRRSLEPGEQVAVAVFADAALPDLQSYQLHLGAGGGKSGHLELVDIIIEPRRDAAFRGGADFQAFNVQTSRMLAGLDNGGVPTPAGAYLATFIFQVSPDAEGFFVIDAMAAGGSDGQTALISDFTQRINVPETVPAVLEIGHPADEPARSKGEPDEALMDNLEGKRVQ